MKVFAHFNVFISCVIATVLFFSSCASFEEVEIPVPAKEAIPTNVQYEILIEGEGFVGSSVGKFQIPAVLVVVPTLPDIYLRNDINPVDIGIFTSPSPIVGRAGALWFGTNTSLSTLVGSNLRASGIDISYVRVDEATKTVHITIDGNAFGMPAARLSTLNIYNLTTGIAAQIHNILAGELSVTFQNDDFIHGEIVLGGSSGFTGPGITSLYVATFYGRKIE